MVEFVAISSQHFVVIYQPLSIKKSLFFNPFSFMISPPDSAIHKLESQQNLWLASTRPDGRPHLVPIWFVWHAGRLYIGTDPKSVKVRNIKKNPRVMASLEDGNHPVICEGTARVLETPYPEPLLKAFYSKYEWDVPADEQYHQIVEITPEKWLVW
jgi:F420H(2)-dependent biliverdin reductase